MVSLCMNFLFFGVVNLVTIGTGKTGKARHRNDLLVICLIYAWALPAYPDNMYLSMVWVRSFI